MNARAMFSLRVTASVAIALIAVSVTAAAGPPVSAARPVAPSSFAAYEGGTLDLSQGWGTAGACAVTASGVRCFRTEAAMDAALALESPLAAVDSVDGTPGVVAAASCASTLRLYDGTSFTGTVVSISIQGAPVSLSTYGFDNKTSSYKVGACPANLYSGIQSGLYGGNTGANAQSASMLAGWNNTISSVYLQ